MNKEANYDPKKDKGFGYGVRDEQTDSTQYIPPDTQNLGIVEVDLERLAEFLRLPPGVRILRVEPTNFDLANDRAIRMVLEGPGLPVIYPNNLIPLMDLIYEKYAKIE